METKPRFKVWFSNGTNYSPYFDPAVKPKDLILVVREGFLPLKIDDPGLIFLHKRHANNSCAMEYSSKKDGAFICPHCNETVNISNDSYQRILTVLSGQVFTDLDIGGQTVSVILTMTKCLETIPPANIVPDFGLYVQEL